jgi:hypothetical protein
MAEQIKIQCTGCKTTSMATRKMFGFVPDPDGWAVYQGLTDNARNRHVYLCAECAKNVPETPRMI